MIDDNPDLGLRYRSPRSFGPAPGPRNIPRSQQERTDLPDEIATAVSVTLAADADELTRLLPPGTRLSGAAELTVTTIRFENLLWLAGRGYPILTVSIPVTYLGDSAVDEFDGRFLAVLWEGLSDPVTTGRDELAFPKLFADISAPLVDDVTADGTAEVNASWDGFRFVEVTAHDLRDAPQSEAAPPKGTIVHRYLPSPERLEEADIDHLVFHPVKGADAVRPTVTDRRVGTGTFRFHHARFEDSPLQYTVINPLAELSLAATGPATFTRSIGPAGSMPGQSAPRYLGATTGLSATVAAR